MFKADPKRISWFHDLKHILHFSKYPIAPGRALRSGRKSPAFATESASKWRPSLVNNPETPLRSTPLPAAALPGFRGAASMTNGTDLTTRLSATKGASLEQFTSRSRGHAPDGSPDIKLRYRSAEKYSATNNSAKSDLLGPPERYAGATHFGDKAMGSKISFPVAPIDVASSRQNHSTSISSRTSTSVAAADDEIPRTGMAVSTSEQAFDNDHNYQDPELSPDLAQASGTGVPQGNTSGNSTIHIDGSALGRWTLQYLERALGKPATGMTGVDPRANLPRSRVAPF